MTNLLAYLILIAIWSTTPIAIKWSAQDLSFAGGIFWRIVISALLALGILSLKRQSLFFKPGVWRYYAIAALGIAPNFLLVYWASLWIPSGLISLIFSGVPFLMGILSYYWLGKNVFTRQRVIALLLAMVGIVVIFMDQLTAVGPESARGILIMLLAIVLFAISSTWLQKNHSNISPLQTTVGGLCFSIPPLALCWWLFDGSLPLDISARAGFSIIYLGVIGSLLGFFLYYFLLQRLSALSVSTVGMISPVFALLIGATVADEPLGVPLVIGAGLVLSALILYHKPRLF